MGWNADEGDSSHEIFCKAVIEDAFALKSIVLLVVKGGGVILKILDQGPGFWPLIEDFCLTFVDFTSLIHLKTLVLKSAKGSGLT